MKENFKRKSKKQLAHCSRINMQALFRQREKIERMRKFIPQNSEQQGYEVHKNKDRKREVGNCASVRLIKNPISQARERQAKGVTLETNNARMGCFHLSRGAIDIERLLLPCSERLGRSSSCAAR